MWAKGHVLCMYVCMYVVPCNGRQCCILNIIFIQVHVFLFFWLYQGMQLLNCLAQMPALLPQCQERRSATSE